jgi:phenylacetic acid degradation operon negative regulatory protein
MPEQSPRHLILSLFGLYARDSSTGSGRRAPHWLSVRSLIALMEDLSVDAAATRSSVSRLKKRAVLEPARVDGQAGYRLSHAALAVLREGDARIWSRPRASVGDGWLVVVFSVPEAERGRRHELRSLLTHLGFGTAAPGVWIAPGTAYDETLAALDRAGLTAYTEHFRGSYLGSGPTEVRVAEWWDLPAIAALYDEFVADHRALTRRSLRLGDASRPEADPARAFTAYVPMLTAWRRLPYLDPGIPLELLPRDWPGVRAGELFATLDARLRSPAAEHAHALIGFSS